MTVQEATVMMIGFSNQMIFSPILALQPSIVRGRRIVSNLLRPAGPVHARVGSSRITFASLLHDKMERLIFQCTYFQQQSVEVKIVTLNNPSSGNRPNPSIAMTSLI